MLGSPMERVLQRHEHTSVELKSIKNSQRAAAAAASHLFITNAYTIRAALNLILFYAYINVRSHKTADHINNKRALSLKSLLTALASSVLMVPELHERVTCLSP
jgi:hypothetical protein